MLSIFSLLIAALLSLSTTSKPICKPFQFVNATLTETQGENGYDPKIISEVSVRELSHKKISVSYSIDAFAQDGSYILSIHDYSPGDNTVDGCLTSISDPNSNLLHEFAPVTAKANEMSSFTQELIAKIDSISGKYFSLFRDGERVACGQSSGLLRKPTEFTVYFTTGSDIVVGTAYFKPIAQDRVTVSIDVFLSLNLNDNLYVSIHEPSGGCNSHTPTADLLYEFSIMTDEMGQSSTTHEINTSLASLEGKYIFIRDKSEHAIKSCSKISQTPESFVKR